MCFSTHVVEDARQIGGVIGGRCACDQLREGRAVDEAKPIGNFLGTSDAQSGPVLDHLDELRSLVEMLERTAIESGHAAAEIDHPQALLLEVTPIEVGNLQLAARRRCQARGDAQNVGIVEIESGDGDS